MGSLVEFVERGSRVYIALTEPLTGEWFAAQLEKAGSGTFGSVFFGEYFLTTSDPGNMKVVLATEFNNFEKSKLDRIQ